MTFVTIAAASLSASGVLRLPFPDGDLTTKMRPRTLVAGASSFRSLGHADQGLLSYGSERSRPALNGEHMELADGEGSPGLEDCAYRLEVIADGRRHEVDFVLHGEHHGVLGEQRERRVPPALSAMALVAPAWM